MLYPRRLFIFILAAVKTWNLIDVSHDSLYSSLLVASFWKCLYCSCKGLVPLFKWKCCFISTACSGIPHWSSHIRFDGWIFSTWRFFVLFHLHWSLAYHGRLFLNDKSQMQNSSANYWQYNPHRQHWCLILFLPQDFLQILQAREGWLQWRWLL
jgi:hypothetical protein